MKTLYFLKDEKSFVLMDWNENPIPKSHNLGMYSGDLNVALGCVYRYFIRLNEKGHLSKIRKNALDTIRENYPDAMI